jgi:nucleoside phosphorylase
MERARHGRVVSSRVKVDLVVLTVIAPEFRATREAFKALKRSKLDDGTVVYQTSVRSKVVGRNYSVALVCIGQPGNTGSAVATMSALKNFSPRAIFLVGIGGGYKAKTKIGEAIFSERIVAYEPAAIVGKRKQSLEPRPDTERPEYSMLQDLNDWLSTDGREARMATAFAAVAGKQPRAPKGKAKDYKRYVAPPVSARLATLAAGEKLVKHPGFIRGLRKTVHGKIEVVEMEAAGFVEACRNAHIPWLIVRGISDFGDSFKNDAFHPYASATASIALADFVKNALQMNGESPAGDPRDYLQRTRAHVEAVCANAAPRMVTTSSRQSFPLSSDTASNLVLDGESYFLSGPSGRGKTTALALMATGGFRAKPVRHPLYLSPDEKSDWGELVARTTMTSPSDAAAWFSKSHTLVFVDDWHRLSDAARAQFLRLLSTTGRGKCALVIAGNESLFPQGIPGLHHLQLPRWTPAERDRVIDTELPAQGGSASWVRRELPAELFDLLREPVLLRKFLQAVGHTRLGGRTLPHDIADLFRQLVVALLSSIHGDAARRADEVTAVCARLVGDAGPITLPTIASALSACGVTREASVFANDLCAAGIWQRSGTVFVFEHEIWRTYFGACAMTAQAAWATPAALTQWATTTAAADLISVLPFVTGLLRDRPRQRALADALLRRDLDLYFRALRTRPVAEDISKLSVQDRTLYVLTELHSGYVDLVERYVPNLKPLLAPWTQGDGGEDARGEIPVVAGTHDETGLRHYWGFAPSGSPVATIEHLANGNRRFAPARSLTVRSIALGDHLRVDSARLISARSLMDQLTKLCKEGPLPDVEWIARERFKTIVKELGFSQFLDGEWHTRNVNELLSWARQLLGSVQTADALVSANAPWRNPISVRDLRALVEIGERFVRSGDGGTTVWDLALPGPDQASQGGFFSLSYSTERKLERVRCAYRAIVETYRSLCEQYFDALTPQMFYAQCPARPIVRLMPDTPYAPTGLRVWWQVVETWEEAMQPDVALDQGSPNMDALADAMRADCVRLSRPFQSFTMSNGRFDWAPWDECVTNEVRQLLTGDMERVERLLKSAS